jgi:hypothetical protein
MRSMSPDDALAILMSIKDVNERRDFVSDDIEGERKLEPINRLALALALEVPFGLDRHWRRLGRVKFPTQVTNEVAIARLKDPEDGSLLLDFFVDRMRKPRGEQLMALIQAYHERGEGEIDFTFTMAELKVLSDMLAEDLGHELGGEVFWSYDQVVSPSGLELRFVFSMLSRAQLLGCVCGPYDEEDDLEPEDHGLRELDY